MAKKNDHYFECSKCEYRSATHLGRCPKCKEYGTLVEITPVHEPTVKVNNRMTNSNVTALKLKDVNAADNSSLIVTGLSEFDRVVGGGIVADSVNVISAPPGAGKSTLLLEVAQRVAVLGKNVLYIAGEESDSQVKLRAERVLDVISDNIYIRSETNLEKILKIVEAVNPSLLIIDSVQMLYSNECDGSIGGGKQLLYCSSSILSVAKNTTSKMAVFFVGQVTKDDELRGTREFEHMVDAVFTLSVADESGILRMLRASKNRFGDASEVGLFEMTETGLKEITNPNKYFITERTVPVSGSAISAIMEGSRTIAIEINTLTESNNFTFASRISQGVVKDFLQIVLAVIENKLGLPLKKKDVYLQTSNGIKVKGTSIGLGIVASIYSSVTNKPISDKTAFIGEVSLTGEIKKVPNIDKIISDFERMGYERIIIPKNNKRNKYSKIEVIEIDNVKSLIDIFKKF